VKLGELIHSRQVDLGESLETMALRARARDYTLTRTTLADFANHPLEEAPRRRTMEALALACDVPYSDVVMAVARSLLGDNGQVADVAQQQHVRSWVTLTEGRSEQEVTGLLRVVRSVADTLDKAHSGDSGPDGATDR